ncbi:hypothetical protein BDM02DRAFT_3085568 [Thelephora ganbajun]|uniref:Uncharacterized protein n=1 Tax=Thelephora ganbajun TaxID=370292 RepID=A0ACB6ZY51_THEGA|nr:hypothetical protein BDM02DRAFT_3085568 [Thelephora ganbajun]
MHNGKALKKADPSTIQDKLLVGYQGWFTCAGDGEPVGRGHHGWLHWFNYPVPDGGRPNTDIWPDVSEYDPSELYEAPGLRTQSGEKCYLFSSRNQKTVDRHFNWMAQHGVDGAFLQRFAGQCDGRGENNGIRRIRDEIGERVREAAEKNGRVFAIMYDVSGVPPGKIEEIIKYDWKYIVFNKRVFDSPSYLREKGKPVVALWGFGFEDSRHTPGLVRSIASYINSSHPGGVYLMAGVPAHWRTSTGDADRNPDFVDVWLNSFDAISPWTIGRYGNIVDADKFAEEKIAEDMKFVSERNKTARLERRLDYIPVVFPGGSGYNLSEGKWGFNDIPREGGKFLWRQVYNARRHGVRTIYGAMWDEYDEGTALMPLVTNKNQLPLPVRDQYRFLAPDADTHDLPSDWYMRICGMAGEILRGDRRLLETFPHKELQDYWGTRPRYEDGTRGGYVPANSTPGASGSGPAHTLAIEENPDEPPPPPYTLEADDGPGHSQQSSYPGQTHSGPSLSSNSPPLSQGPGGYGQHQSSYPGVTNSLAPVPPDRPPTHPPTSNSPPLPQGYGQHQSPYPGMANSPAPGPDRPPMSQPSRPTTPYHQATVPPQAQPPPLPGGYNYPGPTQSTYGGMNPSASPLPTLPHQQTGPGPHGYQQPTQPQYPGYNPPPPSTSPYPGYSGYHPTPPLPPRKCHLYSKLPFVCFVKLKEL